MNIVVVYGQSHRGSTWHWTEKVIECFPGANVTRFYLPKDAPACCVGCMKCFSEGEQSCPHVTAVQPVDHALGEADLIILASPCYVMDVTGAMKTLLDHLAYRWVPHRPHPAMARKLGLCVATTAGAGSRRTAVTLKKSLWYWGVGRVFSLDAAVQAAAWDGIKPQKRARMERAAKRTAGRICRAMGKSKPGPGYRMMFHLVRVLRKKGMFSDVDRSYWQEQGWMGRSRPWNA